MCGRWYLAVTYTHLKYVHGIDDPQDYKDEFGLSKITAKEVRERLAEQKTLVDRVDLAYIRAHWLKRPLRQITSYLGISAKTARAQARKLGLGLKVERWNRDKLRKALQRCAREGIALHSGNARHVVGPLYKAGIKHFGSWRKALLAAGLSPEKISRRPEFESWSPARILEEIRALLRDGIPRDYKTIQKDRSKLYAAARNHFGSWKQALEAATPPPNA